jgi:hypothetical protein
MNRYPCLLANENTLITQRVTQLKFLTAQFNQLANNKINTKKMLAEIISQIDSNVIPIKFSIPTNTTNISTNNNNNHTCVNFNVSTIKEVNVAFQLFDFLAFI